MKQRSAFSMIELIFIIVILGVLATAITMSIPDPRLRTDTNSIIQKIKQTQLKALGYSHEILGNSSWREGDYNDTCISLNKDYFNNIEKSQNNAKPYFLSTQTTLTSTGTKICFDDLGRPYKTNYKLNNFLDMPIELNITYKQKTKQILIMPYSGSVIIKR